MVAVGPPPQLVQRHLDGQAVHVHPVEGVDRLAGLPEQFLAGHVQLLERPQRTEVEDRAEIHVEAIRALPGEDLLPGGEREGRLADQVLVPGMESGPTLLGGQGSLRASSCLRPSAIRVRL